MRMPIPKAMREQLADDPWMEYCAVGVQPHSCNWAKSSCTGDGDCGCHCYHCADISLFDECEGRLQWHHAFTYAGKRVNELWAIIPLCEEHHKHEAQWRVYINDKVCERIKHFKAEADFATKYPKSNLLQMRQPETTDENEPF
jgi:hypothetical protein